MDLNYKNHNLSLALKISNQHYYCNKCGYYIFDGAFAKTLVKFPSDYTYGTLFLNLRSLTCEEIIIKDLLE